MEPDLLSKNNTVFYLLLQEVYARDEGNSPDDHENDMFEKVVRQITNRIDNLEDKLKTEFHRCQGSDDGGRGGHITPSWRGSSHFGGGPGGGGPGGGGGGPGGGGNGGVNNLYPILDAQNVQMLAMKQELDEIKQLLFKFIKAAPVQSAPGKATTQAVVEDPRLSQASSFSNYQPPSSSISDNDRRQTFPRSKPGDLPFIPSGSNMFQPQRQQPFDSRDGYQNQRGNGYDNQRGMQADKYVDPRDRYSALSDTQQDPRGSRADPRGGYPAPRNGYTTEPDRNGQNKARRRRRGRGGRGANTAGDDSDVNSTISEQMPMLEFSPGYNQPQQQNSRNARRGRGRNGKLLTGSWEDIRSETDA